MNKKLIGIIPDCHVPNEDKAAVKWAFKRLIEEKPSRVVFLGDIIDFASISTFLKNPRFTNMFAEEVKAGRLFIEQIKRVQKKIGCNITILAGNHESRLSKYLWRNAPALAFQPELTVPALLGMSKNWKYYPYNLEGIKMDGVTIFHGRKYGSNVCLNNLRKFYGSVVQGHSHRASTQYLRRPNGEIIGAVEAGCLCDFHPGYTDYPNWVHSMAWIENGVPFLELR